MKKNRSHSPQPYRFTEDTETWYNQYDWNDFLLTLSYHYEDGFRLIDRLSTLVFSTKSINELEQTVEEFLPCINILLYELFKREFPGFAQLTVNNSIPFYTVEFILRCSFPFEDKEKISAVIKDNGYTISYATHYFHPKKMAMVQGEKKIPFSSDGTVPDLIRFVFDYFYDSK